MGRPRPPQAPIDPQVTVIHGETRIDPFFWMRDRNDPRTIDYLNAENAYTERMTRHTSGLRDKLYREMKGRIKETDLSVPYPRNEYFYYTRTVEGSQYPIYCRKRGSLDASEEIILDVNELATGQKYFRIGVVQVSPNHRYLTYSDDSRGDEVYTLRVKELSTGRLLPDTIENTYYGVEWANDNQTLFYTTLDAAKRPYRALRHVLGDDPAQDVLVHQEDDERFYVHLDKTRSQKFILLSLDSQITSEVRFLDADRPMSEFTIIHPRQQGMEYAVDHHGNDFYIVTNDQALNFRLVKVPVTRPAKSHWVDVIPHRPEVKLDGVDAFADHLAIYERQDGLERLRIRRLDDGAEHYVAFDEPVYTFSITDNEEYDAKSLRFMYASLTTPRTVYDYNMESRTREMKKQYEVLGGYEPAEYQSERIFAVAKDGVRVPISLVYRKDLRKPGGNPTLLYGYGSYGASMDPFFDSNRISLLDRGYIFAIAHIRGGEEMGRQWYEDGKLLKKKNTFTDFIACAEHLITEKYTSSEQLAIMGGSAGGLLMGAVTTMRPDLFDAVVAQVPFVDVINTMLDASIPLTVIEYEEWGNPNEKAYYEYMKSYSPYDNVTDRAYPDMLITAGLNDPRVAYWEPAKFTAKLRAMKTDDHVLLLKTNMGAGHGGSSGRYDRLKEVAFDYAFIIDRLGV